RGQAGIVPVELAGAQNDPEDLGAPDDEHGGHRNGPENNVLGRGDHLSDKTVVIAGIEKCGESRKSGQSIAYAENIKRHRLEIEGKIENGNRAGRKKRG